MAIDQLFSFNLFSSLLLPFFLQGLVMTFLFFRRGYIRERKQDYFLGILLLLYTLRIAYWMLGFAGWYDERDRRTIFMFYFPFNHWLLIGPLIYFYFLSASNRSFRFIKKHWWHFLPAAIYMMRYIIFFLIDVVFNSWIAGEPLPDFNNSRGQLKTNGLGWIDELWIYFEAISMGIYLVITLRLFKKYKTYINDHFSDTKDIDLKWLRNFIYVNIVGIIIWFGFNLANVFLEEPLSYIEDWFSYFFLGIILYYISIAGYHAGNTHQINAELNFQPDEVPPPLIEDNNTPSVDPEIEETFQKAGLAMENQSLYLDPSLTLSRMAKELKCSTNILSKAINSLSGKNFNDFVNAYRVERFKKRITEPDALQYSLLALAVDCGFNSKATFNRAFKKEEGVSPSAYLKSIQK